MLKIRWILLALTLTFPLFSFSGENENKHTQDAQHASNAEKRGTNNDPIAVKILPGPDAETNAAKDEDRREEKAQYDRWLTWATIALAILTALIVVFNAGLWVATRRLVKGAEETSQKELRAYVATDDIFFVGYESTTPLLAEVGGPSTITKLTNQLKITIKNYGHTPAHRMAIHCECSFNIHDPRHKHGIAELLDAEQMLHPGQHLSFPIPTVNEFRPHTSRFYVIGQIIYHDIYSSWWITDFCYRYEGDGRFTPHGDQNRERGPSKYCPRQ